MKVAVTTSALWFATLLTVLAQIFSGFDSTESQLAKFVASIKQLQPEESTADDVLNSVGAPHAKSNDGAVEVWHYSYLVSPDEEAAEKSRIEQQIAQLQKQRSGLRDRQFKVSAEAFRQRSESLFAEEERLDAAIDQIEERLEPLETRQREMSFQHRTLQVSCAIVIAKDGRIAAVEVEKTTAEGSELVYSKGSNATSEPQATGKAETDSQHGNQAAASHPENPSPGQIYFNTVEKVFYGWNGDSWDKLSGNN